MNGYNFPRKIFIVGLLMISLIAIFGLKIPAEIVLTIDFIIAVIFLLRKNSNE